MDNLNIIFVISQGVFTIISLCLLVIKPFRVWFVNSAMRKQEEEAKDTRIQNSIKCLLRSEILKIYYKNTDSKSLQYYEYENLDMMYKEYKAMGGNSFIDKIWTEIQQWAVIQ